jgi:hypothetical protein
MIKSIGRGPSQSPSFNAETPGRPGVGGDRMQRPSELPAGGPGQVPSEHRGQRPENLGEVRELLQRIMQDAFEGAGKGRPEGAPWASAEKPGGGSGSPFEANGEEPGSGPLNIGQLLQQIQGPQHIQG